MFLMSEVPLYRAVAGRYWYFIAEQPAPALHLAHPEECAALRIVLVTVPRASRSCEHFPDGFDLHLLRRGESLFARLGVNRLIKLCEQIPTTGRSQKCEAVPRWARI